MTTAAERRLPAKPGPALLVGVGLGAFFDGIVFHQILQWHHLVSGYRSAEDLAGLEYNTFWDGLFHLASWLTLVVGLVWLRLRWTQAKAAGPRAFAGLLLIGWGTFHVLDEIFFHLILDAHHIRMGVDNWLVYDLVYTAAGLVLAAAGWALVMHPADAVSAPKIH